jgi:hypothetical protein
MKQISSHSFLKNKNIASIYLVLMCIQLIPIEGYGVSNLKVAVMAFAGIFTIWKTPFISRATIWSLLYFGTVLFNTIIWNNNYRVSTLIYQLLFLLMFNMYYGLVYKGAFTIDFFLRLIKGLIYAYIVVLVLQQIAIISGIRVLPVINFVLFLNRGIGANSLALEPSHAARIMAVAFYVFLKVNEIRQGYVLSFKQLFIKNRWLVLGFLYAMVTMTSGTAFVALAVLSLYFIRRKYALIVAPAALLLYMVIPKINYEPLNRARTAIDLTLSRDSEELQSADGSAAVRIVPILNTIKNLDMSSTDTWLGKGSDSAVELGYFSDNRLMGNINDYGLISYAIGVFLILSCCVPLVFGTGTLLILILVGFITSNIAYIWGIYMLFVPIKYFSKTYAPSK